MGGRGKHLVYRCGFEQRHGDACAPPPPAALTWRPKTPLVNKTSGVKPKHMIQSDGPKSQQHLHFGRLLMGVVGEGGCVRAGLRNKLSRAKVRPEGAWGVHRLTVRSNYLSRSNLPIMSQRWVDIQRKLFVILKLSEFIWGSVALLEHFALLVQNWSGRQFFILFFI